MRTTNRRPREPGLPPRPVMIRAVRRRSAAFDGVFYTAVRSTGIVCRPTCPSRPARAANLTFYARLTDALDAGYRTCRRCRPEAARSSRDWTRAVLARALAPVEGPNRRAIPGPPVAPLRADRISTPLGAMLGVAAPDGLVLLEFADRPMLGTELRRLTRSFRAPVEPGSHPHLTAVRRELKEWFAGRRRRFETPLLVRGTPFQQAAWAALQRIPYGETVAYETQARVLGRPKAVRAVGTANGDNPIAIVIPCHRVRRTDGTLGGYGGGLWRKQRLLDIERAGVSRRETRRAGSPGIPAR